MTGLWASWQRFWFEPESTAPLVLIRVAFGVLVLAWAGALAPDLLTFLGPDGLVASGPHYDGPALWTIFSPLDSSAAVIVGYVAMVVAAVALIAGFQTRLAALIIFVVLTSIERRNVWVTNSGDELIRIIALILVLAPAGAAASIDSWRRGERPWSFPLRSPWALRLLQVQVSLLYLAALWAKVRGVTWNDGTAVSYALRLDDMARFQPPAGFTQSELVANALTYGTLLVEFAIGVLVWNRRLRPYVLLAGVGLHLSIELTMRIGFFSWAVLVAYLAFVPPETAERVIQRVRSIGRESWITARRKRALSIPRVDSRSLSMPVRVVPGDMAEKTKLPRL